MQTQPFFETIIVGLDFSPFSKVVLKQAQELSQALNIPLIAVNALEMPIVPTGGPPFLIPKVELEKLADEMGQFYQFSTPVIRIVREGSATDVLLGVAEEYSKPLIVIGFKGNSFLDELVMGSTARHIVLKSKIPVWVHRGSKTAVPKNILIATDQSPASKRSEESLKELQKQLHFDIKTYTAKNTDSKKEVAHKIAEFSDGFDSLVVTQYHEPHFFQKSQTAEILKRTKVPLLVLH